MESILNSYYSDNAQKLHSVVDRILFHLHFYNVDKDDFYSLANEVFVQAMRRYDGTSSFDTFLYSCLSNKIKTEMTRRNRKKRKAEKMSVSIDTPIGEDSDLTIGDLIQDSFDMQKEAFKNREEGYSEKMLSYLKRLSVLQKDVLRLTIAGYAPHEIRRKLHINEKQYSDCNSAIHSYKNVSVLF